jgi:hypothetical protein
MLIARGPIATPDAVPPFCSTRCTAKGVRYIFGNPGCMVAIIALARLPETKGRTLSP